VKHLDHAGALASPENGQLLTLREVAQFLRVSEKTVRRLVIGRRIPCVRIGRVLRFQVADLSRFVEARKE
jgi:excisionase family DNA binding protein